MGSNTLREKAAKTAIQLVHSKNTLVKERVGGLFVGAQIITEAQDGVEKIRDIVKTHCGKEDYKPIIMSDFENGCGSMIEGLTPLPFLMSLGACNDKKLAYDYGKATALEAVSAGANASFSPVCDLNINPRNPLVNVRSVSDDPDIAIPILTEIIRGMQENGLAACAKHFPGDGVDWRDQHIITSCNSLNMDEWYRTYGRVFKAVIDAGVSLIMPGHISLPAYQKERVRNMPLPATLSSELLQGLLRGELGYKGVIVSDATNMGGFNGWYKDKAEAEIECFKAGCDFILWPTPEYVDNLVSAVENGYISEKRLNESVERIEALQDKYANKGVIPPELTEEQKLFVKDVQRRTAEYSITLIKDEFNNLPLKKEDKKILICNICNHAPAQKDAEFLKTELEERGFEVKYFSARPDGAKFKEWENWADKIIYPMYTRSFRPIGPIDFWENNAWTIAFSYSSTVRKNIYVSFGSPYFGNQYFEKAGTYVNAYSFLAPSIKAFVRALTGEIEFSDFSPVKL